MLNRSQCFSGNARFGSLHPTASKFGTVSKVARTLPVVMRARPTVGWAVPSVRPESNDAAKRGVEMSSFVEGDPRRRDHSSYLQVATSATGAEAGTGSESQQGASLVPVIMAVVVACMGAFAFGYHLAILNGPLQAIAADLGFAGNTILEGLVVSTCLLGAAVGSTIGAGLAEKFGRKGTLMLTVIPLLSGALIGATAQSLKAMIVGRVIIGVGIGLASALVPTYISEIAPTEVRGALGSVNQLVICLGILGALLVNVVCPPTAWRTMFYLSAIPAVLLGLGLLLVPESPRWQYSMGMQVEASEGAVRLWGPTGPEQLSEGKSSAGSGSSTGLLKLLTTKSVVLGALIFVFQQLAGINAIIYFSSSVFAQSGIQSQALASAGVGAINVLGTIIAGSLVDKAGRKQLLIPSFLGMAVSMIVMAAGHALPQLSGVSGAIALIGTLAYVLCFALGVGPVPGVLVSEINPGSIRGAAVSVAMTVHWICNFAIGQLFLDAVKNFGIPGVYLGFAAVCIAAALFVSSSIIETKGRSLEEIERAMA